MKKLHSTIGVLFLISLTLTFVNCKKDDPEPTSPNFNYSTFTDSRDGKTYKYIKIGNQEWMAENLAYKTSSGSYFFDDSESNGAKYGRLYTWEAAKQAVPAGWHLPTDSEWKILEMNLEMSQVSADSSGYRGTNEGAKLKTNEGWENNGIGLNKSGFSALPGGFRSNSGSCLTLGWFGYWWTNSEKDSSYSWYRLIVWSSPKVLRSIGFKDEAYSVRCVKD